MVAATARFPGDENKKSKMVAATVRITVADGEVIQVESIPVENTPPPPQPEPLPSFIDNNNDSPLHCDDRYGYSTTLHVTDGVRIIEAVYVPRDEVTKYHDETIAIIY